MSAVQLGQHEGPSHLIVHVSDTHFLGVGDAQASGNADAGAAPRLHGTVDTDRTVRLAMDQLERSGLRPDAIVFTGDIADRGEVDAYRRVRGLVEGTAERLGAELVWVMGNHDDRAAFRTELMRTDASGTGTGTGTDGGTDGGGGAADTSASGSAAVGPVDLVYDIRGLRLIVLDTSVPGYHHGDLAPEQLDWLADVLSTPAEHGSLLALHHPPVPTPLPLMNILELRRQDRLARVVAGSDIRAILGGHLHYATTGLFAGIPVSVAAATCYTMDLTAPTRELTGVNGGQSINLVQVYDDQVVHSVVPLGSFDIATRFDAAFLDRMERLSAEEREEAFSRHG